jgi:hypothetical protein
MAGNRLKPGLREEDKVNKFRGIAISEQGSACTEKWVYGSLVLADNGDAFIVQWRRKIGTGYVTTTWQIKPETASQYTGVNDRIGNEIYDHDHLYAPGNLSDELQYVGTVEWDKHDARWEVVNFHGRFEYIPNGVQVMGNDFEGRQSETKYREEMRS